MVNELTEQVAERLFNKYDTIGEKRWQRGPGYSSGNWRVAWEEDADLFIHLITKACVQTMKANHHEILTYNFEQDIIYDSNNTLNDSIKAIRALGKGGEMSNLREHIEALLDEKSIAKEQLITDIIDVVQNHDVVVGAN